MKCQTCGHRVVEFNGKTYHKGIMEPKAVLCDKQLGCYRDFCMRGTCSCQKAVVRGRFNHEIQ